MLPGRLAPWSLCCCQAVLRLVFPAPTWGLVVELPLLLCFVALGSIGLTFWKTETTQSTSIDMLQCVLLKLTGGLPAKLAHSQ
jgi:hypothetical protein